MNKKNVRSDINTKLAYIKPLSANKSKEIYNECVQIIEIIPQLKKKYMDYYYEHTKNNMYGHPNKVSSFYIKLIEKILKEHNIYYIDELINRLNRIIKPLSHKNSKAIYNKCVKTIEINAELKKKYMDYYYNHTNNNMYGHPNNVKRFYIKLIEKILKEHKIYDSDELINKLLNLSGGNKKYIKLQSGGKRLIKLGPKGGKYYIKDKKKVYINK